MKWGVSFLIVILLISCREDENPTRTLLTLTVDDSYKQHDTRADSTYVILQTTDGELIDLKRVETGDVVTFDSEFSRDKMDVTIARIYPDASGGGLANVWSYLDVPGGQTWTLRYSQVMYGTERQASETGSYNMVFENVSPIYAMAISDHYFSVNSRSTASPPGVRAGIRKDIPKQLLSLHSSAGNPRYQFVNPKPDTLFMVDYNKMNEFDNVLSVSFSEPSFVYAHVMAYETMEDYKYLTGYVLYDNAISVATKKSVVSFGYLDNMPKFRTEVSASNGKTNVTYVSRGKMPERISLPKYDDVVLQEKTQAYVTYSSKIDVAYRISWFVSTNFSPGTNGTAWYFHAPGGRSRHPTMPAVLLSKFPKIGAAALRHSSSTFYTKSWTYDKFLEREFGKVRKGEEEEYEDVAVVVN
ncbi:MAG TPA: hypothetical protein VFE50_21800 [Cyclobacteriaceae bacterium]|nr:hypothetical protein [Cyclobacteriaceae bacterium]